MRAFSSIIVLLLSVATVSCETVISKNITKSTKWTAEASPIIITEPVYILEGVTLEVSGAVTIEFNNTNENYLGVIGELKLGGGVVIPKASKATACAESWLISTRDRGVQPAPLSPTAVITSIVGVRVQCGHFSGAFDLVSQIDATDTVFSYERNTKGSPKIPDAEVTSSTFTNCEVIYGKAESLTVRIRENNFIGHGLVVDTDHQVEIVGNNFLRILISETALRSRGGLISGNKFTELTGGSTGADGALALQLGGTYKGKTLIEKNFFEKLNCSKIGANPVLRLGTADAELSGSQFHLTQNSLVLEPACKRFIESKIVNGTAPLDLRENYWGTEDVKKVEEHIPGYSKEKYLLEPLLPTPPSL